jgi:thymidylate kinase
MIIILEGENKTGKTTLANYIIDNYGFDYVKCSQPKGDPFEEYMEIIEEIKRTGKDTIIDRFHIGEFVWGPLYRGGSLLNIKHLDIIDKLLIENETYLFYCYDDIENIVERFDKEKEEFATKNKIKDVLSFYDSVLKETQLPIIYHKINSNLDRTKNFPKYIIKNNV